MNTETKWQKEREAFAQGKRIQHMHARSLEWTDFAGLTPAFDSPNVMWRIHPEDDQPAPFVPRFKVGDRVRVNKTSTIGVIEDGPVDDVYLIGGGIGWYSATLLEPAPWQLPAPPEGQPCQCPTCKSFIKERSMHCVDPWHSPSQVEARDKCPHCDFVGDICPTHNRMGRVPIEVKRALARDRALAQVEARDWPTVENILEGWDYTHGTRYLCQVVRDAMIDHAERMLAKEREAHKETTVMLQSLLARIHRDGGHYEGQHGRQKAVEDADEIVAHLNVMKDELAAERDTLRAQLAEAEKKLECVTERATSAERCRDEFQKRLTPLHGNPGVAHPSTGAIPSTKSPGNVEIGLTVHCRCGIWTQDILVASAQDEKQSLVISRTFTEITPEEFEAAQIILGRWLIEHPEISELVQRKKLHQGVTAIDYEATKQDKP